VSTPQTPIGSSFGAASTAAEVVRGHDLSGKVAIVTGGHSGIGLETTRAARHLWRLGEELVFNGRERSWA